MVLIVGNHMGFQAKLVGIETLLKVVLGLLYFSNIGVVDSVQGQIKPFLSCRLLSFGSFTSFTRLFIIFYSFLHYRSVSHNYFIAQKQVSSRGLFFVKKQTLYLYVRIRNELLQVSYSH